MKYRHSHPINILEHTSKFLILLIFPVIRAFLAARGDFYTWLSGAWFDIVIISLILVLGFIAWFKYVYYLTNDGIYIKKGIFLIKKRFIPYKKLSVVSMEYPYYLIPFKAVRFIADTDGGKPRTPDFEITVHADEIKPLVDLSQKHFINESEIKKVYLPNNFNIAILSFISSNSLTGVLFVSAFISGMGKVLGEEFKNTVVTQITELAYFLAFGLPPTAAIIAFTILGGWLVSFSLTLIRHLRFQATRQSGNLNIKSGIFTKRQYFLTVKRINLIELRQSFLTKVFGFYTAFIHCNGYGKRKDELSVLMPSSESQELAFNLKLLLPEIPITKPVLKPRIKYLSRFLIPPISLILTVVGLWIILYYLFPSMNDIISFFGIMTLMPCIWYLCVKILSFFHTGIGKSETAYTFCYTYGYRIKTVAVPYNKIVKITLRRSLFQVMSGCCDFVILTYSEGRKRHVIPNLNFEDAKKMMSLENYYKKRN